MEIFLVKSKKIIILQNKMFMKNEKIPQNARFFSTIAADNSINQCNSP